MTAGNRELPTGDVLTRRIDELERERDGLRRALGEARARERAMTDELQHRVRNMLAVIRTVFRRTAEAGGSPEVIASHFQGRLDAIAYYQADVRELDATGIELEDIVRDQLLQAASVEGEQLSLSGPRVVLRGKTVELMTLAVHELTTNSIKFGALAGEGRLAIDWSLVCPPTGAQVIFRWSETRFAPHPRGLRARGFGRQFIEEALPYQLGAETTFALQPGSLTCTIAVPLPQAPDESTEAAEADEP